MQNGRSQGTGAGRAAAVALLVGCGGGFEADLRGSAQKGPFVLGSSIVVSPLDASGVPTGDAFHTESIDDAGRFEVRFAHRGFVGLEATGFHYDEVRGALSGAPLTLRGFHDVAADGPQDAVVNLVTHLSHDRIRALWDDGAPLADAVTQAEEELRAALGVGPPDFVPGVGGARMDLLGGGSDPNAYLLAASVVVEQAAVLRASAAGDPVDATLQELTNTISRELAEAGALSEPTRAALDEAQQAVDSAAVKSAFSDRIREIGSSAVVPDLDRFLDTDLDGVMNADDGCAGVADPDQADADGDGIGDACDGCVGGAIGPAGGTLALDGVTLEVPPDALSVDTELALCVDDVAGPELTPRSVVAHLTPPVDFAAPAILRLPYRGDPAALFVTDPLGASVRSVRATLDGASAEGPLYRTGTAVVAADARRQRPWAGTLVEDLLFVVDDSASMGPHQEALAGRMAAVLAGLVSDGVDFHVGVVSTDPRWDGELRPVGGRRWIDPTTPDPAAVFTEMALLGEAGGRPAGLGAAFMALELQRQGSNAGFSRDGAFLRVLVVSDDDDHTADSLITRAEFIDWLRGMNGGRASLDAAVARSGPAPGADYVAVATDLGGGVADLADASWPDLVDAAVTAMRPYGQMPLRTSAPATVEVWTLPPSGAEPVRVPAAYVDGAVALSGAGLPPEAAAVVLAEP